MLYNVLRFFLNIVYNVFFRIEVTGLENIPLKGAVIIASNHISLFDPPTIAIACKNRHINFMAKSELFKNPFFAFIITKLGAFPVKRGLSDRNAIKTALNRLNEGLVLGIFPEGTRGENGVLGKAEPGVLMIACKTDAAIIPTAVLGTDKISFKNPFPKFKVSFDRPIYVTKDMISKDEIEQNTEKLMQKIGNLLLIMKKD